MSNNPFNKPPANEGPKGQRNNPFDKLQNNAPSDKQTNPFSKPPPSQPPTTQPQSKSTNPFSTPSTNNPFANIKKSNDTEKNLSKALSVPNAHDKRHSHVINTEHTRLSEKIDKKADTNSNDKSEKREKNYDVEKIDKTKKREKSHEKVENFEKKEETKNPFNPFVGLDAKKKSTLDDRKETTNKNANLNTLPPIVLPDVPIRSFKSDKEKKKESIIPLFPEEDLKLQFQEIITPTNPLTVPSEQNPTNIFGGFNFTEDISQKKNVENLKKEKTKLYEEKQSTSIDSLNPKKLNTLDFPQVNVESFTNYKNPQVNEKPTILQKENQTNNKQVEKQNKQ